jgi:hypothetical protein
MVAICEYDDTFAKIQYKDDVCYCLFYTQENYRFSMNLVLLWMTSLYIFS